MTDEASRGPAKTIYKIFRVDEWSSAEKKGRFLGSPDDIRDGFIHFSTAEQLRGTLDKHFSADDEIVLAAVDATALGNDLKWETARGGMRFPHLYAALSLDAVNTVTRHKRDSSGDFVASAEIP